jgi:ABC-2 type transport system permease protein
VIRVELVKLLRRPRTWVTIVALNALPTLVAVLLAVTDLGPRPGTGPPFLSAVLTDGTLFPLAALGIVLPLFLPVAVAVVGGDAVAGETQSGTLRYLLVRPVGRAHLLLAKLISIIGFVVLAVLVVAVVSYVEGKLFLGDAPAGGVVSVSGSTLTQTEMIQRSALAFVYVVLAMLGVAAIALFLSTLTDSPVAAALGTIGFLIASTVLLGLDAADSLRPYLLTRYWLAFVDLFRDPIRWREVIQGVLAQLAYLVVFAGAAWANFATKDVQG